MMKLKMGKGIHLCEFEIEGLADSLSSLFEKKVGIPRIRYGKKQTFDTLINEEALLLAKFPRRERETWIPRTSNL